MNTGGVRRPQRRKVEIHHILGAEGAENVMNFSLFLYEPTHIYTDTFLS